MKKLTRERVVPTISASVSWLSLGITVCGGLASLPNRASSNSTRASRFSLELQESSNSPADQSGNRGNLQKANRGEVPERLNGRVC